MADFSDLFTSLYDYNTDNGIIVADTSTIKSEVESAMKRIFGNDFSTDASTTNGRLIEVITKLFVDACGVNAQNANQFNLDGAIGNYLDRLGALWNIHRSSGESDGDYRNRIISSASRGSGFARSIENAIGKVTGVSRVVVLDNGLEDPNALPRSALGEVLSHSIAVDPHSVAIFVLGGADNDIVSAVKSTKSAGCGITNNTEYGTLVQDTFYRPTQLFASIAVQISTVAYSGTQATTDATTAIRNLFASNSINTTITSDMVSAALLKDSLDILTKSVTFKTGDSSSTIYTPADQIVIPAYRYIDSSTVAITITT